MTLKEYGKQNLPTMFQGTWTLQDGSTEMSLNLVNSKYPNYKQIAVRRSSFNSWPSRLKPSKLMAECGFFSTNSGDSVRCYHCGIGLRNWDPEDDPWVEHARWSPTCQFVQHEKGQEFINLVQAAHRQAEMREALEENAALYQPKTENQGKAGDIQEDGSRVQSAKTEERKNPLLTSCAQSVLAMGYRPRTVSKAIDRVVEHKGWDELSGENIMKVIFDMEDSGEINSTDEEKADNTKQSKETEKESSDPSIPDTTDRTKLMAENEELKDRTRCKICCENSVSIVFLPCGHLVCCAQCAPALKNCAICRKEIKGTVRVCLS
ncbi:hypothetical protein KUTeg_007669 [Tegillarca granosa]|uniref:RING-type domain-containing protein n=1 Tax=Tegillarca granosa TaxID=220873 RepID=A0ABQ9FDW6_TEGGR|nr:hypothetical protein KUTeg_007669 [Tegillarca granosa]